VSDYSLECERSLHPGHGNRGHRPHAQAGRGRHHRPARHQGEEQDQILYEVEQKKIVGKLGTPDLFPNPEGDLSLSPNGEWFVNGYKKGTKNYYAIYRRSDGAFLRSKGLDKGDYSGDIRIDPAPRWNRTNDAILVPGIAKNGTRQMFVIRVVAARNK
jgi:hypothetical protein|tara:strand:- start:721 stop:1194 length:474 start_codon:yes stop_codon:yes gene_type:complete